MGYVDRDRQRAYQREWIRRRREAWFAEHGPCVACGSWDDLHADHVDPGSKVSHRVWSWSRERRAAELAKCQVLCRPCHEAKTAVENAVDQVPHGTHNGYSGHGCRCPACREAQRVYNAAGRARRDVI